MHVSISISPPFFPNKSQHVINFYRSTNKRALCFSSFGPTKYQATSKNEFQVQIMINYQVNVTANYFSQNFVNPQLISIVKLTSFGSSRDIITV